MTNTQLHVDHLKQIAEKPLDPEQGLSTRGGIFVNGILQGLGRGEDFQIFRPGSTEGSWSH